MTTTTATATWTPAQRDDYGRPCTYLRLDGVIKSQAVVVTLSKAAGDALGGRYMVNVLAVNDTATAVTHHANRAAAKAFAEGIVASLHAAGTAHPAYTARYSA